MPELPEVEAVRRLLERCLGGRAIASAEVFEDPIVFKGVPPKAVQDALVGASVEGAGRKGKVFWLKLDRRPWVFGHLGMSGWVRRIGGSEKRLVSHGKAPLDDPEGRPRFAKLVLEADDGARLALTDGRRLGRVWLSEGPGNDPTVTALGPDALDEPYQLGDLAAVFEGRTAPIKALLLDQRLFAGVGNWVADEALFHARLAPARPAGVLGMKELARLIEALAYVLRVAVEAGAESDRFPEGWLFHHRWGGRRGSQEIDGHPIRRDKVGGRTTAWVPDLQS